MISQQHTEKKQRPVKGSDDDSLTTYHLQVLTAVFGAIRTGSSVLGGEKPDSDIDVFLPACKPVWDWLKNNGFHVDEGIEFEDGPIHPDDQYGRCDISSLRHPASWINCIVCHPDYYPSFRFADAKAKILFAKTPEMALTRNNRVDAFKVFLEQWDKLHVAAIAGNPISDT